MDRRDVLRSAAAVGAVGMMSATGCATQSGGGVFRGARAQQQPLAFVRSHDGVELFYRDWGTGRPLVFLAPWGLHCDWWEYQMAYLTTHGRRCVAYDRRGHGRSGEPATGYEFDTLAGDLAAVLDQLVLHDVTLVGQSLGCGEIVRYLSQHGDRRIARCVMIAPITPLVLKTADNPDGVDAGNLDRVRDALSRDRPHAIAGAAPSFFGVPKNVVSAEMLAWWTEMLVQCPLRVLLELHRMFTVTDFRNELTAISLPTLIIHGDNDTSTPIDLTGRKTATLIVGSRLTVYEGAAHALPITHMDRLNQDLLEFTR